MVVALALGCAPVSARVHRVLPRPAAGPPTASAATATTAEVTAAGPQFEPPAPETSLVATASIDAATKAVGGAYQPIKPVVPLTEPQDAALDARWGAPWYLHLPKPTLAKTEVDAWAASVAREAEGQVDADAAKIAHAHELPLLRTAWLAALGGDAILPSEAETFGVLIAACRAAAEELEREAGKTRARFGVAMPAWLPRFIADAADVQAARVVAGTEVQPSWVRNVVGHAVAEDARELVAKSRDRALDAGIAVALADRRAWIMAFARRPKQP